MLEALAPLLRRPAPQRPQEADQKQVLFIHCRFAALHLGLQAMEGNNDEVPAHLPNTKLESMPRGDQSQSVVTSGRPERSRNKERGPLDIHRLRGKSMVDERSRRSGSTPQARPQSGSSSPTIYPIAEQQRRVHFAKHSRNTMCKRLPSAKLFRYMELWQCEVLFSRLKLHTSCA